MNELKTDILIIGAGLTGLSAGHFLKKSGSKLLIVDSNQNVGGVIQSIAEEEFIYEKGPNTGIVGNDSVCELFDDLADTCKLVIANENVNRRLVLKNGKWHELPSGLLGGITTPLFSFKDKLRILGEPFRKPSTDRYETLDKLVLRRMGKSFLDYAVDPFILGIYAGDPAYLVPRFALPKLYNLEQKYGSFIGGSIKQKQEKKRLGIVSRATRKVFSVEGGLSKLTEAIAQSVESDNIILGVTNLKIAQSENGYIATGTNHANEPITIQCKKIISTVGANKLTSLFPFVSDCLMAQIDNLIYAKVIQVSLGFKNWNGTPIQSFGGLIPHREKRNILGILFPSALFPNRAPQEGALLSVFMGGMRRPDIFDMSDTQIKEIIKAEVMDLMGMETFAPDLYKITRYESAIPQYGASTEARLSAVRKIELTYPGLIIAGNLRDGIGMADRIQQGKELVEEIKMCKV